MTQVASYVFIDLETTGLPQHEYNKTRITELCMVVVRRRHILDKPLTAPRVQEKLTLCLYPRRLIHPDSSAVTGLDNDLLEHQTPFNMNVFNTINSFLQCLEKPVCLVAQNGHNFDFPILKNHFEKLGVSLPDDILCADSLHLFYDIESKRNRDNAFKAGVPMVNNHETNGGLAVESSGPQKQNNITSNGIVEEQMCNSSNTEHNITEEILKDFEENDHLNIQQIIQKQNEKTPIQKQGIPLATKKKGNKVRRQLFYEKPGTKLSKKPSISYKLKNVYERLLGRPAIVAHRAEHDCIMSMEASVAIAEEFIEWIDNADNHCKFSEVKAMKLGVPLGY